MPVVAFDLALSGQQGRGVFLYYEDVRDTYPEWESDGQRIFRVDERWKQLRPCSPQLSREALQRSVGRYLALEAYELTLDLPSTVPRHLWSSTFEKALRPAGADRPLARPRFGEQHPCYVQGADLDDDDTIDAELPASFLNLQSMYFYLASDGRKFTQEMQMT